MSLLNKLFNRPQAHSAAPHLLISFCNLPPHVARYSLAVMDGNTNAFYFLKADGVMAAEDIGITGIARTPDGGYALGIQSPNPRVVLLNHKLEFARSIALPQSHDIHSLITYDNALIVTATRSNEVYRLPLDSSDAEMIWSHPLSDGYLHLNCPMMWQNKLYVCAHRHPQLASTDRSAPDDESAAMGTIINCTDNRIVATGLQQPHSLMAYGDGAMIASSFGGDVYTLSPDDLHSDTTLNLRERTPHIIMPDYIRGIAFNDDTLYLGGSARRIVSRKQGVTRRYVDDPFSTLGDPRFHSNLYRINRANGQTESVINMTALGFDIYDIMPLPSLPDASQLLSQPEILRAQAFRNILTVQEMSLNEYARAQSAQMENQ